MDGIVAVTYRCNSRCAMCDTWQHPSKKDQEIRPEELENLPSMVRLNVTGGEPFLRDDLGDILDVVTKRAQRVVVSTNGFATRRTLEVMRDRPGVGIRVSIDGVGETHDRIRGVKNGFARAMETLAGLGKLGVRDLGIAVTVSDMNAEELVPLYHLSRANGWELATAVLHNAYYFHKMDNVIADKPRAETALKGLAAEFLNSRAPKDWFRAYFTYGLIDYMYGRQRRLTCSMATDSFFVDPFGNLRPCNVMDFVFGNIRETPFNDLWNGPAAEEARRRVGACQGNCWMIGSVGHLMRHRFWVPVGWILRNKAHLGRVRGEQL